MDSRDLTAFDTVVNCNEDFCSDPENHNKLSFPISGLCAYPTIKKERQSHSVNDIFISNSFTPEHNRRWKPLNASSLMNSVDYKCGRMLQSFYSYDEPLRFTSYRPISSTFDCVNLHFLRTKERLASLKLPAVNNYPLTSSNCSQSIDTTNEKQTMPVLNFTLYKPIEKRMRSLSEASLHHVCAFKESTNTEPSVNLSLGHYEKELNYLKQQLIKRTKETEKIADELMHVKHEEKQFDNHLRELTKDSTIKADTIAKLKEKVSELYVEVESLRCTHLEALCHQKDLEKEIDNLRCSRDWYADQLFLTQSARDRFQNEPDKIQSLLRDSSEINHRLTHENACLQAQLACSKASLADAKRNLSRQLESIRIDMIEREAIFERISAERASFENISRQRADEIRELQIQVSNLQMELKVNEEHLLHQKGILLKTQRALEVSESRCNELQNMLNSFEREHSAKENYLNDQISKYNIILESLKEYDEGHKNKGILIDEILEEKATLTAALSSIQCEKETLNDYLVGLKDNLIRVEESFSILKSEIESKSTHIAELTSQRDDMIHKIATLQDQLSSYWTVIESLKKEKEELNSALKVLHLELENYRKDFNKLNFPSEKADFSMQTAFERSLETESIMPSHVTGFPASKSTDVHFPDSNIKSTANQQENISSPFLMNDSRTAEVVFQLNEIDSSQELHKNERKQIPTNAIPITHSVLSSEECIPCHENPRNPSSLQHSRENCQLNSSLSTNEIQNSCLTTNQTTSISINYLSKSYEINQSNSEHVNSDFFNPNNAYPFNNVTYMQLPSSDLLINSDLAPGLQSSNTLTTAYSASNQQHYLNTNVYENQDSNPQYESYHHTYDSNNLPTENSCLLNSGAVCSRIAVSSTEIPSSVNSIHPIYSSTCKQQPVSSEQSVGNVYNCLSDQIPQQDPYYPDRKNTHKISLLTEQDSNGEGIIMEEQDIKNSAHTFAERKINVRLAEYFMHDKQNDQLNVDQNKEYESHYFSPTTEVCGIPKCSYSPFESSNGTYVDNNTGFHPRPCENGELYSKTVILQHSDEQSFYQSPSISEAPNDSGVYSASQSDITTRSSVQQCNASSAPLVPSYDDLKSLENERDYLSELTSILRQNLAEAVNNMTTSQKEAEVQSAIAKREMLAHEEVAKAHNQTLLELDTIKAELIEAQKLVGDLRQEVTSLKEENTALLAREDEKQSHYETEIKSMKTIIKITSDHLSTLAQSLQDVMDEKAMLQEELNHLKSGIRAHLSKFSLFTRMQSHGAPKVVNQSAISLAALGIDVDSLKESVNGDYDILFQKKQRPTFNPSFELLRAELMELENDLLSHGMITSGVALNDR
ncbi:unnamed protein product [Trichobilharzia szidati]|nr:unnamed protein product [Trichobilharzia szidati]